MLGSLGIATALQARLQADGPTVLADIRTRHGWSAAQVPDPTRVLEYEPAQAPTGQWPFWYVAIPLTAGKAASAMTEIELDRDSYRYRYRPRIFAWVRTTEYATATLLRAHLLAIQETLLLKRVLVDPDDPATGPTVGQHAEIDPNTITLVEGQPDAAPATRTIQAGYLELEVWTMERLQAPAGNGAIIQPPDDTAQLN